MLAAGNTTTQTEWVKGNLIFEVLAVTLNAAVSIPLGVAIGSADILAIFLLIANDIAANHDRLKDFQTLCILSAALDKKLVIELETEETGTRAFHPNPDTVTSNLKALNRFFGYT